MCCAGQDCTTGLPALCDDACAPAFNEFWEDCGSYVLRFNGSVFVAWRSSESDLFGDSVELVCGAGT